MILKSLHVTKRFRIDQIYTNFLKEGASVIAIPLAITINLSIEFVICR